MNKTLERERPIVPPTLTGSDRGGGDFGPPVALGREGDGSDPKYNAAYDYLMGLARGVIRADYKDEFTPKDLEELTERYGKYGERVGQLTQVLTSPIIEQETPWYSSFSFDRNVSLYLINKLIAARFIRNESVSDQHKRGFTLFERPRIARDLNIKAQFLDTIEPGLIIEAVLRGDLPIYPPEDEARA